MMARSNHTASSGAAEATKAAAIDAATRTARAATKLITGPANGSAQALAGHAALAGERVDLIKLIKRALLLLDLARRQGV